MQYNVEHQRRALSIGITFLRKNTVRVTPGIKYWMALHDFIDLFSCLEKASFLVLTNDSAGLPSLGASQLVGMAQQPKLYTRCSPLCTSKARFTALKAAWLK